MKKVIIGNWKMNPRTLAEAAEIFKEIVSGAGNLDRVSVVVCPPSLYVGRLTSYMKKVVMGGQDSFWGDVGAYTGQASAPMLKSVGVKYVIVGHSERRDLGDSDEIVNKKLKSVLSEKMKAVFCIGESLRDESGEYLNFIRNQIFSGLKNIRKESLSNLIIAYEPIWAIGKDALRSASPQDVLEMGIFIKKVLAEMFGREVGIKVPVIYGGSADATNCADFLEGGKADGLLVGRASLDPSSFIKILKTANDA